MTGDPSFVATVVAATEGEEEGNEDHGRGATLASPGLRLSSGGGARTNFGRGEVVLMITKITWVEATFFQ